MQCETHSHFPIITQLEPDDTCNEEHVNTQPQAGIRDMEPKEHQPQAGIRDMEPKEHQPQAGIRDMEPKEHQPQAGIRDM